MASPHPDAPPRQFQNILMIHNPHSGRRDRIRFRRVVEALEHHYPNLHIRQTRFPGHAAELAAAAGRGGHDLVIAAGGDGTISETVNGLYPQDIPLAVLPLGTANVFAREIGLDLSVGGIVETILRGQAQRIRPGRCNGRLFLLMASCGLDSLVVHRVSLRLKKLIGGAAYGVKFLHYLFTCPSTACAVRLDGVPHDAAAVIVSRGRLYGGDFLLAPAGSLFDEAFQVVMFQRVGRRAALAYGLSLLRGNLARRSDVLIKTAREVDLEAGLETAGGLRAKNSQSKGGLPIQMDGDPAGRLPASIRLAGRTVTCLVPQHPW